MDFNFTTLAIIAAGCAAVWNYAGSIVNRIKSLFLTTVTIHGQVAISTYGYLQRNGRVLKFGDRLIRSGLDWIRPIDCISPFAYETATSQYMFMFLNEKHGKILSRLLLFKAPITEGVGWRALTPEENILNITYLRGFINIDDLIKRALEESRNKQKTGERFFTRKITGKNKNQMMVSTLVSQPQAVSSLTSPDWKFLHWSYSDIGTPICKDPFSYYVLDENTISAKNDFLKWKNLKNWYKERNIPWRRGHLYFGDPGTGKTSFVRAVAQESDFPIFIFDLSTLDNQEFNEKWKEMQEHTPCIALIEDIDGCFNKRININDKNGLTFDCLLNAVGGVDICDGVFLAITTNKPETLDEALCFTNNDCVSRPGRIDKCYKFSGPSLETAKTIIRKITGNYLDEYEKFIKNKTAAQITEYAISLAMKDAFNDEN